MQKVFLSHYDQMVLDSSGRARSALRARFPEREYYAQPSKIITGDPQQLLNRYKERFQVRCDRHSPIITYDIEMVSKCGPQGGKYAFSKLERNLSESYALASVTPQDSEALALGCRILCDWAKSVVRYVGKPQVARGFLIRDTAGGLPTKERKTTWLAHVVGAKQWLHPWPDLPNGRRQRGKDRIIHEDAAVNVDYIEPYLSAVRHFMVEHFPSYFSAWLNPQEELWPLIDDALTRNQVFLETDYLSMDTHFHRELVRKYLLPLYDVLLEEADYWHFASFVDELFEQPIYMGEYMLTGLHNLLSGQAITNDFETLISIMLYLGTHTLVTGSTKGFRFAAIGDDCVYANKANVVERVYARLVDETSAVGLVLSTEKTRIQDREARFCRMVYYDALPRRVNARGKYYRHPAYPPVLALNNILQPEHPNPPPVELAADMARLDNCVGFYRFQDLLSFVFPLFNLREEVQEAAWYQVQEAEWWSRFYGTTTPKSSPSAKAWSSYLHK